MTKRLSGGSIKIYVSIGFTVSFQHSMVLGCNDIIGDCIN